MTFLGVVALCASQAAAQQPYVLIQADAALYVQPDGDDAKGKVAKAVDLESAPHRVLYAELVERHEGWVAVRTASYRGSCTKALATAPVGLVLWVKPADIVPVLTRPVELSVDGVTARLHPGVPMRSNVDGTWTAAVDGLQLTGVIPDDAIGQKFEATAPPESPQRPTHTATGTFGNAALRVVAQESGARPVDGGWVLEKRCLTVQAPQLEGDAPISGPPTSHGGTARRIAKAWALGMGTPFTWPDGVAAGQTVNAYRLEDDEVPDPPGRRCGPVLAGLVVCVDDPTATEKLPPPRHIAVGLDPRERVEPKHPKGEVKGEAAKCRATIDLGPGGQVQEVTVRACEPEFAEATKEAVMQWTYAPHEVDGKPVPTRTFAWVSFEG